MFVLVQVWLSESAGMREAANAAAVAYKENNNSNSSHPYAKSITINRNTAPTNNDYSCGQQQNPE